jgi:hypothetical protein
VNVLGFICRHAVVNGLILGSVLKVQTSSRLSLQIKRFWASLNIILIPAGTETRCKYEEATRGSKITKTLKLAARKRQHSERLPADFVFLQFTNPDGTVIAHFLSL